SFRSARHRPSKRTLPDVGRSKPTISFSATVLPQPLSPMIASVCPCGTPRARSRRTCCGPKLNETSANEMSASGIANRSIELHNGQAEQPLLQTIEEEREEEIDHQDGNERQDERFGRRPADAFAAGPAMKPAMTTDEGDKHPENYGFREA